MMTTILYTSDDMVWLRSAPLGPHNLAPGTSLPKWTIRFAILTGNEDCPDTIEVYEKSNPELGEMGVMYVRNFDGLYISRQCEA